MPTCTITGTIKDASGAGVADVPVRLTPKAPTYGSAEARGGVGILLRPVEVLTDASGAFALAAEQGFRYTLDIPAIGFSEEFVAPATASVRFDLLGLVPRLEQAQHYQDADGADHVTVTAVVDRVDTARERFEEVALEWAPTANGAYAEVEAKRLEPGRTTYTFDHAGGVASNYYRARLKHSNGDAGAYCDPIPGDGYEAGLVITPQELRAVYLNGAPEHGQDGQPFPDRLYAAHIQAAVEWLEKELDIPITPVEIEDEVHDHYTRDYTRWGYFQLNRYPVIQVRAVSFQYPTMSNPAAIDLDWVVLEDGGAHGVVQIVPGRGTIADVLIIPGAIMPTLSGAFGRVPATWHFSYRAGFEHGALPEDIKHLIALKAAHDVLAIIGDQLLGAGVAAVSLNVPGLGQSVTAAGGGAAFQARMQAFAEEIARTLPVLKAYYGKSPRMTVV